MERKSEKSKRACSSIRDFRVDGIIDIDLLIIIDLSQVKIFEENVLNCALLSLQAGLSPEPLLIFFSSHTIYLISS